MDENSPSPAWLLLLAQLPSSPSSARVALWRRLRAIGATGMVNSAWVLPNVAAHAEFFENLLDTVHKQGGTGFVLNVTPALPEVNEVIVQRFRADRNREYDEFAERCTAFLEEIGKETQAGKFIFAELEEGEQDLEKLTRWLAKIQARDFFPDERWPQAEEMLRRCRDALGELSRQVYAAEGMSDTADSGQEDTGSGGHSWSIDSDPPRQA
jgi:Protein ChrB, N-terminal